MAIVLRKGVLVETIGELPAIGSLAPAFILSQADLSDLSLDSVKGTTVVLNIFPSIDTPTCATSVRHFNAQATKLKGLVVVCISADLPFALGRFCGAEGIENVLVGSTFRSSFGIDYQVTFATGPLTGLLSRSVIVIDADGIVRYTEQVENTSNEPHYGAALKALKIIDR
ncbi:MAG: thiol peroxidase [Cellvibrionaceae bacterium]|jgi:thiol peroxidase